MSLRDDLDELQRGVDSLKAALWQERYWFLTVIGVLWLGLALSILAFGPDWL